MHSLMVEFTRSGGDQLAGCLEMASVFEIEREGAAAAQVGRRNVMIQQKFRAGMNA